MWWLTNLMISHERSVAANTVELLLSSTIDHMDLCSTLGSMLPAHQYEYTQRRLLRNMVYYTDTMGTLRRKCTRRSIFWSGVGKRLTPPSACSVNLTKKQKKKPERKENKSSSRERAAPRPPSRCSARLIWGRVRRGGGWRVRCKKTRKPPLSRANSHTSIFSRQPGKHPSIFSTADRELLSNAGFRWQVL